jgi:methionine synthase I (cobalamin-dependent)
MKYCIVMLLVILIDDGIMGIVLSNSENSCNQVLHSSLNTTRLLSDNTSNTTTPTTPHEMTNCDNNYANINAYITDTESAGRRAIKFTSFIAQLLLLIYFRDQQNKLASYIDERTTTMSDYSIRISNIPQGETDNK